MPSTVNSVATLSPVMQLFALLRKEGKSSSHRDMVDQRTTAFNLAVSAGLWFDLSDFLDLHTKCNGGYWMGDGEYVYRKCIEANHTSACRSFESWKKRPAFMHKGSRLCIGSTFEWDGKQLTVTSIVQDHRGWCLGCCSYRKVDVKGSQYKRSVVDSRVRVSLAELKAGRKKDSPKPDTFLKKFVLALGVCDTGRRFLQKFLTIKEAWEAVEDEHVYYIKSVLTQLKYPILHHEFEALRSMDEVRKHVGNFDKNLLPLVKEAVRINLEARQKAKTPPRD